MPKNQAHNPEMLSQEVTVIHQSPDNSPATIEISPALREKLQEAREALEDYEDIPFPIIRAKDGKFILGEGLDPVDSLEGIILYTKANNVYYKNPYKSGIVSKPDCYSRDARIPNVEKPVHPTCKGCPLNEFGSKAGTEGKACRNIRLVFFLLKDSILPSVLRIPPTSLRLIDAYILNTTNTKGSYFNVMTKVTSFKKDEGQSYHNWRFSVGGSIDGQEKVDMKSVRDLWLARMKTIEAEKVFEDETSGHDEHVTAEYVEETDGRAF